MNLDTVGIWNVKFKGHALDPRNFEHGGPDRLPPIAGWKHAAIEQPPEVTAVYAICHQTEGVLYIGQTENLKTRMKDLKQRKSFIQRGAVVAYEETPVHLLRLNEAFWLHVFRPPYNRLTPDPAEQIAGWLEDGHKWIYSTLMDCMTFGAGGLLLQDRDE